MYIITNKEHYIYNERDERQKSELVMLMLDTCEIY